MYPTTTGASHPALFSQSHRLTPSFHFRMSQSAPRFAKIIFVFAVLLLVLPGTLVAEPLEVTGVVTVDVDDPPIIDNQTGADSFGAQFISADSTLNNHGQISSTSSNRWASGVDMSQANSSLNNFGTIFSTSGGPSGSSLAYGVYSDQNCTVDNQGTINSVADNSEAYGIRFDGTGPSFVNSGTIVARGHNGYGFYHYVADPSASARNAASGIIQGYSATGYGIGVVSESSFINEGILVGYGDARSYGAYFEGSQAHLINSGTIAARAGGLAINALDNSNVTLGTGTRIRTVSFIDPDNPANNTYIAGGEVYAMFANLELDGTGTVDFDITGNWLTLAKTGAGTWTVDKSIAAGLIDVSVNEGTLAFARGVTASMDSLIVASGATLGLAAYNQNAADLTVSGTATLGGTVLVDPGADTVGESTILSAGTLDTTGMTLASANADFDVALNSTAGGDLVVTTIFDPATDAASQSLLSSVADVQSFAEVAQSRTLSLLDPMTTDLSADSNERGPVMLADNSPSLAGLMAPQEQPTWRVFLQPVHSFGSREAQGSAGGYASRMMGVELGADRRLNEHWLVGGFLGYGVSTIDFDDSDLAVDNREEQEMTTLGVYTGWRSGDWMLGDTLSATYVDHSSQRYAGLGETATADYESWVLRNQLLALYHYRMPDDWSLTPHAGLNLTHVHRAGFSESGATNALSYDDLDKTFLDLTLGARLSRRFEVGGGAIAPYAGLGLIRALNDGDITVRQYLATTSAEMTTENDDTRVTSELGLILSRDSASLTLGYTGEFSEHGQNSTLSAMLRWAF